MREDAGCEMGELQGFGVCDTLIQVVSPTFYYSSSIYASVAVKGCEECNRLDQSVCSSAVTCPVRVDTTTTFSLQVPLAKSIGQMI